MQPEALREAQDWLARAEQDLRAAEMLLTGSRPLPGIVAYHTQQAAEKALKGFLAAHNRAIPLTHNLNLMLPLCEAIQPEFSQFAATARTLTPLATEFRYPGGPLEPPVADAEQALRLARDLIGFVRRQLGL